MDQRTYGGPTLPTGAAEWGRSGAIRALPVRLVRGSTLTDSTARLMPVPQPPRPGGHLRRHYGQLLDDLALPPRRDSAVAEERRQHPFVARFWLHALKCSGVPAKRLAEPHEGVAKAVRIEVRQPRRLEGAPEDRPDRRRRAPVLARQAPASNCRASPIRRASQGTAGRRCPTASPAAGRRPSHRRSGAPRRRPGRRRS